MPRTALQRPLKPHLWYSNGKWEMTWVPLQGISPVLQKLVIDRNTDAWNWTRGVEP